MSSLLSTLLVASSVTLPSCSWDRPGVDPYMGDIQAAVDRYRDIPVEVRARLKEKMRKRAYDDIATITRDRIEGKQPYSDLRDMHFGKGRICRQVTRSKWGAKAVERGLVYCEGEHCLIVPTVCRNVSRVTPEKLDVETAFGQEDPAEPPGAGTNVLAGQRFVDGTEAVQARAVVAGSSLEVLPLEPAQPLGDGADTARFISSIDWMRHTPAPAPAMPVPEPSTWMLMALGVGLVCSTARRKRRVPILAQAACAEA